MTTASGEGNEALYLMIGAAARTLDVVRWSGRTAVGVARTVPGIAGRLDAAAAAAVSRGEETLQAATQFARTALRTAIREVVAAALVEVDLTKIVRDHVDLDLIAEGIDVDAVAERIDLGAIVRRLDLDALVDTVDLGRQIDRVDIDAIAARIDIDAIIARIDLLGLADQIIDGVDLPQIIRDSTGSLSSEAVRGVRSQGMQADDAVAGFVGRLFGRDRPTGGPADEAADTELDENGQTAP
ncbi:hypothetical protein [Rhodococcus spelaei]|uniref:hypothetical protein n=1 Tax=Rhodococcus spelaei TaxID=2546320 RepID=UPI0015EFA172|nr:hypothetical protein [Rhodococcus spelaei]